jgi:hypothetical protein
VPVDGSVTVIDTAWFTFTAVALTVGADGTVSAEFTFTTNDPTDVCVSGTVALSVTT